MPRGEAPSIGARAARMSPHRLPDLSLLVVLLGGSIVFGASASAQDASVETTLTTAQVEVVPAEPAYPPPDDDLVLEVPRTRAALGAEIARLEAIAAEIDTDGSDYAMEIGAQMTAYGVALTLLGLAVEGIAQSLSSSPWSGPPVLFLAMGGVGGGLAAIGVPLFTLALCDPGSRREGRAHRRLRVLRGELDGLPPDPRAPEAR